MPAKPEIVTIGLVQMRCQDDPEANLVKAVTGIRQAAAQNADIVCLQELFRSCYFCQGQDSRNFDLAEPIDGPTIKRLSQVAQETGTAIIAPFFERRTAGVYHNSAALIERDGSFSACTEKCISRMIRCTLRSTTSLQGTWASAFSRLIAGQ